MLQRLNADLRAAIQGGIDSGQAIAAEDMFAAPNGTPTTKIRGKHSTRWRRWGI